jgi:hypothetical protein
VKRFRSLIASVLLATAVLSMPALQGCGSLGLQQPETFSDRYAYALGQTTAIRDAARVSLDAKQISIKDAEYALQVTDRSRQLLDTAKQVADAGEVAKAQGQLALVTNVLTQLQTYLNARTPK